MRLRILGVDPGSATTGYGVVERDGGQVAHVAHGTLRPGRGGSLPARLLALQEGLAEVVGRFAPDVASVEQVFVSASPRSALVLGQARGVLLAELARAGVAIHEYDPRRIKQAVSGYGAASKDQIRRMVQRLLGLERLPQSDPADALAAALCHAQHERLAAVGSPPRRRRRGRARSPRVRLAP
jgi:crossover junction endodeoxyribonuclease RuvC